MRILAFPFRLSPLLLAQYGVLSTTSTIPCYSLGGRQTREMKGKRGKRNTVRELSNTCMIHIQLLGCRMSSRV